MQTSISHISGLRRRVSRGLHVLPVAWLIALSAPVTQAQDTTPRASPVAPGDGTRPPQRTPIRQFEDEGWKVRVYRRDPRRLQPPGPAEATPILGEPGKQLLPGKVAPEQPIPTLAPTPVAPDPATVFVALVNGRRMSRADLNRRVAIPMKRLQGLTKAEPGTVDYEEVRTQQEGSIVGDWVDRVLLAEEAKRRRIMLSQAEFDQRYTHLIESPEGKKEYENTLKVLGMTPEEVKAELYDQMLGEKVVDQEVQKYNTDEYLRPRYDMAPQFFLRPEQVHVLLYSMALEGTEGMAELRKVRDKLDGIRRRIAKGESPVTIAQEEGGKAMGVAGLDLGWVALSIHSMPLEVQKAALKMKPGETSSIILSEDIKGRPAAFHIVKVIDYRPATGDTYDSAKPIMLESLKESVRTGLVADVKQSGTHKIVVNLSGIPAERLDPGGVGGAPLKGPLLPLADPGAETGMNPPAKPPTP